jgi:peptidoglycan/xylan/chitin deacetylase (PgdA/CDA1 family)
MIRTRIKTGAATVLCRTGLDRVAGALSGARRNPLIVGYHRVVEDFASSAQTSIPSLLVSRGMLERHLDWIGRRYRFVDLDELGALLESGRPIDRPVAAITFDDGYRDFYDHALPVLQKKGVPAALFVVTDLVGTAEAQIHDKLYLLLARRYARAAGVEPYQALRTLLENVPFTGLQEAVHALESEYPIPEPACSPSVTWEELGRIHRAGIVVGSHTRTHIVMTNETCERVIAEVAGSRRDLERTLGTVVRHFAYPSGIYNSASVNAVADAGYQFGFTSCTHRSSEHPLLTVPRTLWWEHSCVDANRALSEPIMSCLVNGAFSRVAACRQKHTAAVGSVGR